MTINTYKELKQYLGSEHDLTAASENARIVYVNGNKVVLPLEVHDDK